MTTPRDAIAGLSERLHHQASGYPGVSLFTEAATQLDSLLKERDALQARVKDQQEGMETLAKEHLELARDFDKLSEMSKTSETLRKNALSVAEQWQSRALRAEQERDEAHERLKPFAEASDSLDESHLDRMDLWESPSAMDITAGHLRAARDLVRRLAGPEKEKK